MPGEEEKGQTNDAIEFNKGAKYDEAGRPEVALFLYQGVTGNDNGSNGDVELLHKKRCEQSFAAKPKHKHLLPTAKRAARNRKIEG